MPSSVHARNERIRSLFFGGHRTKADLSREFNLSRTRIYDILFPQKYLERLKKTRQRENERLREKTRWDRERREQERKEKARQLLLLTPALLALRFFDLHRETLGDWPPTGKKSPLLWLMDQHPSLQIHNFFGVPEKKIRDCNAAFWLIHYAHSGDKTLTPDEKKVQEKILNLKEKTQ